ncbi:MAG: PHP domain-containing protein [Treponema sp.]|jgi:predicted metal-dependent phosphoesterase TrpH|nr:PHP domain-containing protein [Treponema sp.]
MIDLHTHSTASDGSLSPSALMAEAAQQGLSAIALTDHDTINGLNEAQDEAERRRICFIPGIEIEINWGQDTSGGEFHLLGLGLKTPSDSFRAAVAGLARLREARNLEILERMHSLSIDAEYQEIRALSGGHSVGRPHFAAFLVQRRIVKNTEQAFKCYLGKGKPLYAPKPGMDFEHAVSVIRESGGISVLAHPMSLYVAWGRLPDLVKSLKARGLEGIEAWHPLAPVRNCLRLEELGNSLGLFVTAGSDFHGETRADRKLGMSAGKRKIEDRFLLDIPPLQEFNRQR